MARTSQYGDLRVWVDVNSDGISQSDELHSLNDVGVASLEVQAQKVSELDNNNWLVCAPATPARMAAAPSWPMSGS
jgi:hypothetical protein